VWDTWGDVTLDTGTVVRFRFTAREFDQETGLYYYRARYYDPKLGRFLSEDPIGIAGGLNLYAYAGNDPVNGRDPFGLDWCDPGDPNCTPYPFDLVTTQGRSFYTPPDLTVCGNIGLGLQHAELECWPSMNNLRPAEWPLDGGGGGAQGGGGEWGADPQTPKQIGPSCDQSGSGRGTLQTGAQFTFVFSGIALVGSFGTAIDVHGNIAPYATGGIGGGTGAGGSVALNVTLSNAATICDLKEDFAAAGVGAGVFSVETFAGPSPHGYVQGAGVSFGPGVGASGWSGVTWTSVGPPIVKLW